MEHLSVVGSDRIATVGEVFSECDPAMLLDVILDCDAGWSIPYRELGNAARSVLTQRVCSTLGLMRLIYERPPACEMISEDPLVRCADEAFAYSASPLFAPGTSACNDGTDLLVPWESFEVIGANGEFMRTIGARILHRAALESAREVICATGGRFCSYAEWVSGNEPINAKDVEGPLDRLVATGLVSSIDTIIGEAWHKTLSRPIWLPGNLCLRELYGVVANVFWAMTYTGFPEADLDDPSSWHDGLSSLDPIPASFYASYDSKMDQWVDMLNFNCWVDTVERVSHLRNAA